MSHGNTLFHNWSFCFSASSSSTSSISSKSSNFYSSTFLYFPLVLILFSHICIYSPSSSSTFLSFPLFLLVIFIPSSSSFIYITFLMFLFPSAVGVSPRPVHLLSPRLWAGKGLQPLQDWSHHQHTKCKATHTHKAQGAYTYIYIVAQNKFWSDSFCWVLMLRLSPPDLLLSNRKIWNDLIFLVVILNLKGHFTQNATLKRSCWKFKSHLNPGSFRSTSLAQGKHSRRCLRENNPPEVKRPQAERNSEVRTVTQRVIWNCIWVLKDTQMPHYKMATSVSSYRKKRKLWSLNIWGF